MKKQCLIVFILIYGTLLLKIDAQEAQKPLIENLIFEGAGIRGIAYAGALEELANHNLLHNVKRVGGTSAGAITALTVSLNYSPGELKSLIAGTNFRKFNDGQFIFFGGLHRLTKYYGWYRGRKFDAWLAAIIRQKTGDGNCTFAALHQKGFKDLYVTATDLTAQKLVVFSAEHTPHIKIKDAVRMSMSIPLYFQPLFMDSTNKVHYKRKRDQQLSVMVDGGIIGNFPIWLLDSTKYIKPEGSNSFFFNEATLGFRIDSKEQIKYDELSTGLTPIPVTNFKSYIKAFYSMVIEGLNRPQLTPQDWTRTVSICDGNLSPRVRKLNKTQVATMITCGRQGITNYLQKKRLTTN